MFVLSHKLADPAGRGTQAQRVREVAVSAHAAGGISARSRLNSASRSGTLRSKRGGVARALAADPALKFRPAFFRRTSHLANRRVRLLFGPRPRSDKLSFGGIGADEVELLLLADFLHRDDDAALSLEVAAEQFLGKRVFDIGGDATPQRPGTVIGVAALVDDELLASSVSSSFRPRSPSRT